MFRSRQREESPLFRLRSGALVISPWWKRSPDVLTDLQDNCAMVSCCSPADEWDSERILHSQPMKEELFVFGRQNNLFTHECVLCLESFPAIVFVSLKPLQRHERTFWCYLRGFGCSLRDPNNTTIFYFRLKPTSKLFFKRFSRFLKKCFAPKG